MLRDGHSSGHALLRGSSDLPGGWAHRAGTRSRHSRSWPKVPPYLVLLRVGFALPAALLRRRCAHTAPFHPYLGLAARAVCFLWHFPSKSAPEPLPSRTLSGTLLCGVRTFLCFSTATVRSGCQQSIIVQDFIVQDFTIHSESSCGIRYPPPPCLPKVLNPKEHPCKVFKTVRGPSRRARRPALHHEGWIDRRNNHAGTALDPQGAF